MSATVIGLDSVVCASGTQVFTRVADEVVILELGAGQYFSLEGVGPAIWSVVQNPVRVSAIRDVILRDFDVERETCERDLLQLMQELVDRNLVELRPGSAIGD